MIVIGIFIVISVVIYLANLKESDAEQEARLREFHRRLNAGQDPWAS